ncbi:hypothetical protein BC827DRAFT_1189776 [Russula dissimulans]|nr:hypothetical protein BC827DRAFT_1189776 [Russula dissimulans]
MCRLNKYQVWRWLLTPCSPMPKDPSFFTIRLSSFLAFFMTTNSPPDPARQPERSIYMNGDASRPGAGVNGAPRRPPPENARFASVTVPIPKALQPAISLVSSIPDKLALAERCYLTHVLTVVCIELAFLKCIGCSNKVTLYTIFVTCFLGSYACRLQSNLQRMQGQLDSVFWMIGDVQRSIKSLEFALVVQSRTEDVPVPAIPTAPPFSQKDAAPRIGTPKPTVMSPTEPAVPMPERVEPPVATNKTPYPPYEISATSEPAIVIEDRPPSVLPAVRRPDPSTDVQLEGTDNRVGVSDLVAEPVISPVLVNNPSTLSPPTPLESDHGGSVIYEGWEGMVEPSIAGTMPATPRAAINNLHLLSSPAPSMPDHGGGITFESMDNNVWVPHSGSQGGSSEQIGTPTQELAFNRWLPALREIKQRLEQFAQGRFERISQLNQGESPNTPLRRYVMRLLMSAASLSPANFVSAVGYMGPPESTPYYPTGDLQDRIMAFANAMDCLDDLEDLRADDGFRISTKLFELAQALSDLGLHEYALNTSGFALDTLERPYVVAQNNTPLQIASVLSLRANILCDLKRSDEARNAAERALSLCREYQSPQTAADLDLAYTSLNYAVLLSSFGLKDESAAVAFELLNEVDESQPDMKIIFVLCKLCLSIVRPGAADDTDLYWAEETIESTRMSSDMISQAALAGALLAKSKILSSKGQNDSAMSFSAEAVTLLRSVSSTRPAFSLFLAHALDTHAHDLSEANRKGESYSIRRDAVELWQRLKVSARGAIARPLAWSLFELAKFRHSGHNRDLLREELRIAELAVEVFRDVEPLDTRGLGDALYLFADRMLELDRNQEAVTYAEESVLYFREAASEDPKYALDLIFSLSLASSCLACTERADYAFEYAKQAVEVHHGRKAAGVADEQYTAHLRKLLVDVFFRATEMDIQAEALPWFQELQTLGGLGDSVPRRSGSSRGEADKFKKQTSYWIDEGAGTPRSDGGSISPAPVASSSTLTLDKGKGKEVFVPSPEVRSSTPRVDKGKAKEVNPPFEPNSPRYSLADEEILSPGVAAAAAAQRRFAGLGSTGLAQRSGSSGGRALGSRGSSIGSIGSRSGSPSFGGNTNSGKTDKDGGVAGGQSGASSTRPSSRSSTVAGTRSGTGIQSRLSEDGA